MDVKFQFDLAKFDDSFFPMLLFDSVWNQKTYEQLKLTFPDFSGFKVINVGQRGRKNVRITKKNSNLKILQKRYPLYAQLFTYISSKHFLDQLRKAFPDNLCKSFGFKGSWENTSVLMDISKSQDGYENPFHVDTRGRIVHILIYFGNDEIQEGGEFCIAKHKPLQRWNNYPQIPSLNNIEDIRTFPVKDNFGVIVLSTPNSYHKGNRLKGTRKFIYISINNHNDRAWDCDAWFRNKKKLDVGLKAQINTNPEKYKEMQELIKMKRK